jgi:hypothetical protein
MLSCRLSEETHEVAQRKLQQMAKLRNAMGLSEVREGEAFDPEAMAARRETEKAARQAEREAREAEREVRRHLQYLFNTWPLARNEGASSGLHHIATGCNLLMRRGRSVCCLEDKLTGMLPICRRGTRRGRRRRRSVPSGSKRWRSSARQS